VRVTADSDALAKITGAQVPSGTPLAPPGQQQPKKKPQQNQPASRRRQQRPGRRRTRR